MLLLAMEEAQHVIEIFADIILLNVVQVGLALPRIEVLASNGTRRATRQTVIAVTGRDGSGGRQSGQAVRLRYRLRSLVEHDA